jgi:hypothetical protein
MRSSSLRVWPARCSRPSPRLGRARVTALTSLAVLVIACTGDSEPTSTPTAPPDTTATASPSTEPTATATASTTTPTATPTPEGPPEPFLPDPPPSPFEPWTGEDLVVYDVVAGVEVNLGPGLIEPFSVERPTLGLRRFLLDRGNEPRSVMPLNEVFPDAPDEFAPPAVVQLEFLDGYPYWLRTFRVETPGGTHAIEAYGVALLDESRAVVAVLETQLPADGPDRISQQEVAILLYDLDEDSMEPLATALASPLNWSFDAAAGRAVWVENQCVFDDESEPVFVLLDVDTGDRIEFTSERFGWVELTPDGRLALSRFGFGASAIFNPSVRQYDAVLPEGIVDAIWSADYRYAAAGTRLGHGGLCASN